MKISLFNLKQVIDGTELVPVAHEKNNYVISLNLIQKFCGNGGGEGGGGITPPSGDFATKEWVTLEIHKYVDEVFGTFKSEVNLAEDILTGEILV